jgi:hypothetical protein
MGIMPHTDVERALGLALGLDIPFWPQLPKVSFHEDMYVQASQNFPGIIVDSLNERLSFSLSRFEEELAGYSESMADPGTFALSGEYSVVYHRFLSESLEEYAAVRGQLTGPVSFGFKVVDEDARPIIYDDGVRNVLFDFLQRKANAQYRELRRKNENAFVWLDEPGLGWVFTSLSGYNDVQARRDYRDFVDGLEGIKALHLCANVNLPYLLELGIDLVSFDAYQMATMPAEYAGAVAKFLDGGGIICWGIVPTDSTGLGNETPRSLAERLKGYWDTISRSSGMPATRVAARSLLAPARCCLKNIGQVGAAGEEACSIAGGPQAQTVEERLVEQAFAYLRELSSILRDKYGL